MCEQEQIGGNIVNSTPDLVSVAALIGDPSRAMILVRLLGGRAVPASELAAAAKITPQTASAHLSKLVNGGLLTVESHGRHRYYRLANEGVAHALETLNAIAPGRPLRSLRESDESRRLRFARTCYDHLAGEVGVAVTDQLLEQGALRPQGRDYELTATGDEVFARLGIRVSDLVGERRQFARQCLDWSERRYHLAGALGAALLARLTDLDWIERVGGSRAVRVTARGREGLQVQLGLVLHDSGA